MTPQTTSRRTKAVAAATAVPLLFAVGGARMRAGAEPVQNDIPSKCAVGGSSVDVTVPLTVDDKIDPATDGGQEILENKTGLGQLPVEVTINKLVVTTPIPSQVATVNGVTFTGGNMAASYEVAGSDLIVTFTGPVSSSSMDVPVVTADLTLATGIAPTTINWMTFRQVEADTNYGMATCTPNDPNQVVNTTTVEAGEEPPPTTEPTPPPSTDPPPTTEPTEPTTPPTTEPTTAPTTGPTTPPTTEPTTPPTTEPAAPPAPGPTSPVPGAPGLPVPVPGGTPAPPVPVPPVPAPPVPLPVPTPPGSGGPLPIPVPVPTPPSPTPAPGSCPLPLPVPVPAPCLPVPTPSAPAPAPAPAPVPEPVVKVKVDARIRVGL